MPGSPQNSFSHRLLVEFADTDAAGIMHFSNFFRFMEVTEHAFFRSLGLSILPDADSGDDGETGIVWPRAHASAEYLAPLKFEDEVEVELLIEEIASRTVKYLFRFWKNPTATEGGGERALVATGRITVICVSMNRETRSMNAVEIPPEIRKLIDAAPADLLKL